MKIPTNDYIYETLIFMRENPIKFKPSSVRLEARIAVLQRIVRDKRWSLNKIIILMIEDHKLYKEYKKKIKEKLPPKKSSAL